jgi:wobble nucleotide-excising tRNase
MITKINISRFGLFNQYEWDKSIGRDETFRRLNIIYGRNYSGKTTLSRIFKCIENNEVHRNYAACEFSIINEDNTTSTQNNLADFRNHVRVYNTDFVRDNLSWLHSEDGSIVPFTILGAKNVELDNKISEITEKLGSLDEAKGLVFESATENEQIESKKKSASQKKNTLQDKLRSRANDRIKTESNLFVVTSAKRNYTISDIQSEIDQIKPVIDSHILQEDTSIELVKSLKESTLADIEPLKEVKPNFETHLNDTISLLEREIKPSQSITALINDSLLQEWVRSGIDKHRGKRDTCGFCGGPIDRSLWDKLDAHFSIESEELRAEIKQKIERLTNSKIKLSEFMTLKRDHFYASLHARFEDIEKDWQSISDKYRSSINVLIENLSLRERDIFNAIKLPEVEDYAQQLLECIQKFNGLLTQHNLKSGTLTSDQSKSRIKLRFSHIAQFIKDIDYLKEVNEIEALLLEIENMDKLVKPKMQAIEGLLEERRRLEAQANDESKGAELVNQHLSHFFGHEELKLVAEGESPQMKFTIQRDGDPANNLSEGECSLISFCYFIAKMEDELKDATKSGKLIIYVDDPISSLDCNHIFFMFSLIENIIAKPQKYGQLFISTHNLDFLKYLKQLTYPKYTPQENSREKPDINHFMIERKGRNLSILKKSPTYLKEYITEFNYLFHQIYKCSLADEQGITSEYQYSFGNNLRKFLEGYTFYKYPNHKLSFLQRLDKFFDGDNVSLVLINRFINEYSHLENQFDRAITPIDVVEISKISKAVINKLKSTDAHQYDALLESIN